MLSGSRIRMCKARRTRSPSTTALPCASPTRVLDRFRERPAQRDELHQLRAGVAQAHPLPLWCRLRYRRHQIPSNLLDKSGAGLARRRPDRQGTAQAHHRAGAPRHLHSGPGAAVPWHGWGHDPDLPTRLRAPTLSQATAAERVRVLQALQPCEIATIVCLGHCVIQVNAF